MKLVVNDANILIDLVKLHMLPDFFALDLEFHTTALVLDELYDEQKEELQSYIDSGTLHVNELEAEEMMEVFDLQAQRPVLSPQDCSALFCAEKLGGALISSWVFRNRGMPVSTISALILSINDLKQRVSHTLKQIQ